MVEKVNNTHNEHTTSDTLKLDDENFGINLIRHKLNKIQTTIIKDVEQRVAVMADEIMQELRQHELQVQEFQSFAIRRHQRNNDNETWNDRSVNATKSTTSNFHKMETKNIKEKLNQEQSKIKFVQKNHSPQNCVSKSLPDKIFTVRESYLTALLKVDHMRSIYNIFLIIFLVLCLQTITHDYFVEKKINLGLRTFKSGFRGIHFVLGIWTLEHVFVFLLYYAFRAWSFVRIRLTQKPALKSFWSHSCLILYIASQFVFGYIASVSCLKLNLPFVSSSVLLLESTRLLMKMHAFVRTNAARIVAGKLKSDNDVLDTNKAKIPMAPFSWYLYFLFAPTLIYRDSFPRTSTIRWKFALARFIEVWAVAFLFAYLHERYIKVHFGNYGLETITTASLIVKLFGMCMPSFIIFLCGFYLILHAWLNFTAELLRFGDRMFYKDWWTSFNYDAYYRKWNVVVHDWLYEYIYKDTYNYVFRGSKVAASLMVFTVSALVHEHILGFSMQLFFPVMFVFFGLIGVIFVFITRHLPKSLGNLFLWFSLIIGNSLMVSLYFMEYYARANCTINDTTWRDMFVPAILKCGS